MRNAFILVLGLLPAVASADGCPPLLDTSVERHRLLEEMKDAPDEGTGRALISQLWQIWSQAPDGVAQQYLLHGMHHRTEWDFYGAIKYFDLLVEYCPEYAEGYNQRAFVNFIIGEYALAAKDLEAALRIDPEHLGAKAGLAVTLIHLGRIRAGQEMLREALTINRWLPERSYLTDSPGQRI